MRSIFIIMCFIWSISYGYGSVCDSLKSKVQSLGHADSASILINEAINISKANNNLINQICTYKLKAKYCCETNECKINILENIFSEDLLNLPSTYNEKLEVAKVYVTLATYQKRKSLYEEAKENYEIADSLFLYYKIEAKDYKIGQLCLKPLGSIYTRLGDYERALKTFKRAEEQLFLYNAKPDNYASLYLNMGNVYNDLEAHDSVIAIYKKGLNTNGLSDLYKYKISFSLIKVKFNNYIYRKSQLLNETIVTNHLFDSKEAIERLKKMAQFFEKGVKIKPTDAHNYLNGINSLIAEISLEFKLSSNQEAIKFHKKALFFAKKRNAQNPNAREIAKKHYTIGQTYLDFSDSDSAKHHFYLGLQTILPKYNPKQNPLPDTSLFFNENAIFENLEGLAEVFTQQDSLDLALQAYELAFYVKLNLRSMYDFESSKLYLQQKAKEVNRRAIAAAYQLYQSTKNEHYIERAFKIAESSRALVLLEGIMQNQLRQQSEQKDSVYLAQQKAKFDKPIDFVELQSHLQDEEVLIEYFQADSLLYVFKFEKNKEPKFYKLQPNWQTLDQLLEAIRSDRIKAEPYTTLAYNMYKDIFAPLEIPTGKKIIIIPDGQLNYLPFEVLLTQISNENSFKKLPYLLKDHTINYQYSATIFSKLLLQTNEAEYDEVLSIAPIFEDTANELRFSEQEVNAIAKLFSTKPLLRNLVSKENIINKISAYNILHFSTHASGGDPLSKQQAHIVLHNDTLHVSEIYQQAINANLTVLSACETNTGKYEGGEGVMSLSRAFAYAGCPSLVSTLWQVNDKSTKDIVVEFYKNLKEGASKDVALQQAKLTYLKNSDDAHPFYWASLVVIGNTQALEINRPLSYLHLLWLLFPLGIGIFLIFRRKLSWKADF